MAAVVPCSIWHMGSKALPPEKGCRLESQIHVRTCFGIPPYFSFIFAIKFNFNSWIHSWNPKNPSSLAMNFTDICKTKNFGSIQWHWEWCPLDLQRARGVWTVTNTPTRRGWWFIGFRSHRWVIPLNSMIPPNSDPPWMKLCCYLDFRLPSDTGG